MDARSSASSAATACGGMVTRVAARTSGAFWISSSSKRDLLSGLAGSFFGFWRVLGFHVRPLLARGYKRRTAVVTPVRVLRLFFCLFRRYFAAVIGGAQMATSVDARPIGAPPGSPWLWRF